MSAAGPLPAKSPSWLRVTRGPLRGGELLLLPGGAPWQEEMQAGHFEALLHDALTDEDLAAGTVWDVGAHVGYHTLAFAARVGPAGRVIAFEPNPPNALRLRQNLARNPVLAERVHVEQCALSDRDGADRLFCTQEVDDGTSSGAALESALTRDNEDAFRALDSIVVTTFRGDALVQARRVPRPSVLKIDVEGGEVIVLRGCVSLLAAARPLLLMEVHSPATMSGSREVLSAAGYGLTLLGAPEPLTSRCHVLARPTRSP